MNTGKMIVGILGAAAAGVVLGLLIAPEKGSELRKDIKRTADDWMDEVSNLVDQGKELVDQMAHKKAQDVKEQVDKKTAKVSA